MSNDPTNRRVDVAAGHSVEIHGNANVVDLAAKQHEMGRRLWSLYVDWTCDDAEDEPGACENMGSGADVCESVFAILTDNGFPIA